MDPFKNNDVRPPLTELSTNTLEGGRVDAMHRKRERERARYAAMSDEQKNELKKRRESRNKENLEGHDDARQRNRERERARYAMMSAEKKNELKKRRESRKKGNVVHHEDSEDYNIPANKENNNHQSIDIEDANDGSYWLHGSNSFEVHRLGGEENSTHLSDECPEVFVSDGSIDNLTIPCDNTLDSIFEKVFTKNVAAAQPLPGFRRMKRGSCFEGAMPLPHVPVASTHTTARSAAPGASRMLSSSAPDALLFQSTIPPPQIQNKGQQVNNNDALVCYEYRMVEWMCRGWDTLERTSSCQRRLSDRGTCW